MESWPLKSIFDLPSVLAPKAKITLISRFDKQRVEFPLKDIDMLASEDYDCFWEAGNTDVLARTLTALASKRDGTIESLKILKNGSIQCKIVFQGSCNRPIVRRILRRKFS